MRKVMNIVVSFCLALAFLPAAAFADTPLSEADESTDRSSEAGSYESEGEYGETGEESLPTDSEEEASDPAQIVSEEAPDEDPAAVPTDSEEATDFQQDEVLVAYDEVDLIQDGSFVSGEGFDEELASTLSGSADVAGVKKALVNALTSGATTIDISKYNIPKSDISSIYQSVINSNPQLFYVRGSYSYSYVPNTSNVAASIVVKVTPVYYCATSKISAMKKSYEKRISQALTWIPAGASDAQAAKALHDWLYYNVTYNANVAAGKEPQDMIVHSSYGAMVNGDAVCQGYALAFLDLCKRADIPCAYVASTSMNHAWNIVKLSGSYYHVDATWDDPVGSSSTTPSTKYFLKSSAKIPNHYGWSPAYKATSTTYDSATWKVYKAAATNPKFPATQTTSESSSSTPTDSTEEPTPVANDASQKDVDFKVTSGMQVVGSGDLTANLAWKLYDTGLLVIEGTGEISSMPEAVPWEELETDVQFLKVGAGVTALGSSIFSGMEIRKVSLPEGLKSIGASAFEGCSDLEYLYVPASVTSIGPRALFACSSLTTFSFVGTSRCSYLGDYALSQCVSLGSVSFPSTLSRTGEAPLAGDVSLALIAVNSANKYLATDGRSLVCSDGTLVAYANKSGSSYAIPSKVGSFRVTRIGVAAFASCANLTSVTIPNGVTEIANEAFFGTKIGSVTIPASVVSLGADCFANCTNLTMFVCDDYSLYETVATDQEIYISGRSSVTLKPSIAAADIVLSEDTFTYSGAACRPTIKVSMPASSGIVELVNGNDYTYSYSNNVNAGMATITITGKGSYANTSTKKAFVIKQAPLQSATLTTSSYTYSGKAFTPQVTVKANLGSSLKTIFIGSASGQKVTLTYSSNVKVGTAKVVAKGTGNYCGSITKEFTIKPTPTYLSGLLKGSKSFKATWVKKTAQVTGYQIRYSTKSSMAGAKKVTVKSAKTTSRTIKYLKSRTRYYVQVRTYKTVGGKTYYSSWSAKRNIVTK